jgi:hypothetical protein
MTKVINIFAEKDEEFRFILPHNGDSMRAITISYADLVKRLDTRKRTKHSATAKISKDICMKLRAIKTGVWSTGHRVSTERVTKELKEILGYISDYKLLTPKAQAALIEGGYWLREND